MSEQGQPEKSMKDLIAQVQELTTNDRETPRTTDQTSRMSLHHLLQDPVKAAIYHRGWMDRTRDMQEKQKTSFPLSSTTLHTYRGPRLLKINKKGKIQIFVKFFTGKMITLKVKPSDTIGNLKSKIQQMEGFASYRQRLILNGEKLEDHRKISDYKIREMTIIHIITCLRSNVKNRMKKD